MNRKRLVLPIAALLIVTLVFEYISIIRDKYDNMPTLNVLMFHMVTEKMPEDMTLNTLYITDDMLENYCNYFNNNYKVVSLEEAYDIIKNNKSIDNPNMVAFTFDDGYDNNYYLAYPVLREQGIKANINIIAKYTDECYPGYLNWEQVKEMSDSGIVSMGSHSYDSHFYTTSAYGEERPVLSTLLPNESENERKERIFSDLELADYMISKNINKDLDILAYPYGVPPFDLVNDIENRLGYNIQLMVRPGVNREIEDFSQLKRFAVNGREEPQELENTIKKYDGLKFLDYLKYN